MIFLGGGVATQEVTVYYVLQNELKVNPPSAARWSESYQSSALPAEAGILQPCPHVFMWTDDQRAHHQDPLPVLHDSLAALETQNRKETMHSFNWC